MLLSEGGFARQSFLYFLSQTLAMPIPARSTAVQGGRFPPYYLGLHLSDLHH